MATQNQQKSLQAIVFALPLAQRRALSPHIEVLQEALGDTTNFTKDRRSASAKDPATDSLQEGPLCYRLTWKNSLREEIVDTLKEVSDVVGKSPGLISLRLNQGSRPAEFNTGKGIHADVIVVEKGRRTD